MEKLLKIKEVCKKKFLPKIKMATKFIKIGFLVTSWNFSRILKKVKKWRLFESWTFGHQFLKARMKK